MSSNQQRQQPSGWGAWNGKGVPGLNRNGERDLEKRCNSSDAPPRDNRDNCYPCQLPASYGQGVYEEVQPWVAPPPKRLENEREEDYEWGDEPGTRTEIPTQYCPKIKAGPNCNFFLAPGETMEQCPYDKGHQILTARFLRHLEKCRHNYVNTQKKNKKPIEIEVCQYDTSHHIQINEMPEHVKTCPASIKYRMELENIRNAALPSKMPTVEPPIQHKIPPTSHGVDRDSAEERNRRLQNMTEENWELTTTMGRSFNPVEMLADQGTLFFCPQGLTKSERAEFRENENARARLLERKQNYLDEQAKKYGFNMDKDGDTGIGGEADSEASTSTSTSSRSHGVTMREMEAKKRARQKRDAHFAKDPFLAKINAELEERAKIFKLFVYKTRPSDDWMDK